MSSHAQIRAAKKKYIQRALKRHQRNINAACSTNNDELNKANELKSTCLNCQEKMTRKKQLSVIL